MELLFGMQNFLQLFEKAFFVKEENKKRIRGIFKALNCRYSKEGIDYLTQVLF